MQYVLAKNHFQNQSVCNHLIISICWVTFYAESNICVNIALTKAGCHSLIRVTVIILLFRIFRDLHNDRRRPISMRCLTDHQLVAVTDFLCGPCSLSCSITKSSCMFPPDLEISGKQCFQSTSSSQGTSS